MKKIVGLLLITFSFSHAFASEEACIETKNTIVEKIECLDNVTVEKHSRTMRGLTQIEMTYTQPMDHNFPGDNLFEQKIVLIHRDISEPMLLQTSGYSIFGVRLAHIARVFETNQLQIEHRYFEKSIPSNPDWSKLNIKQSADDFHAITKSFKKIYKKNWVNTGASKGGMTSVYHRYFYPDDLVGTVADVAPLSFSRNDQRYNTFLENVGGDQYKSCRDGFKKMQKTLLENRELFVPRILGEFTQLGSAAVAYEHSVLEAPFFFWQYGKPSACKSIPASATPEEMFSYFQTLADVDDYSDAKVKRFMPYYFQAATQLGSPAVITEHLEELRHFEFDISQYTPIGVEIPYSNKAMRDVREWALNTADEVIYVYGAFDPWTAAEFPVSTSGKNTYKFMVPAGNHGANFTKLTGQAYIEATSIIGKWLGKELPSTAKGLDMSPALEDIEFDIRKSIRL
jgi:hypothetical protein